MKLVWSLFIIGVIGTILLPFLAGSQLIFVGIAILMISFTLLALKVVSFQKDIQEIDRLRAAYEQVDQQAKLIIRTDLELHQTQEELDRRLASLMSLHEFQKKLKMGIGSSEIYAKLDSEIVTHFGFSKGMSGSCEDDEKLTWESIVGISQITAEHIKRYLLDQGLLKEFMSKSSVTLLHSSHIEDPRYRKLLELVNSPTLVITPVLPRDGVSGLLIFGRTGSATTAKADQELIEMLASYLEMTVESTALFEKAYQSQQILERKVLERTEALEGVNAELTRLNRAKTDFVSAVSHELRTPLAAIKGYASLLCSGRFGEVAEAQKERLAKIEKHSDLLTQLINNLLDIARIESGRITMEQKPIAFGEFLDTVNEMVKPQIDAKKINYDLQCEGIEEILGDEQHLQRVFMNLLSNAVKYTPEEGTITLNVTKSETSVTVSVIDTGCGIPEEDVPKLFQEFYRSADPINKTIKGTGLGLALVKRIIEAHKGTLTVTSEQGKGSTFAFDLPQGVS